MLAAVDWHGIATVIAALGAALAAVIGALNRRTAQKVHEVGVANNMLLAEQNGSTKTAEPGDLKVTDPPSVPVKASS